MSMQTISAGWSCGRTARPVLACGRSAITGRGSSRQRATDNPMEGDMLDLGIAGRKAIVCAASKGLGRACAMALGKAGVELVITARTAETLEQTASDIRRDTGAKVTAVAGDITT